MAARVEVTGAGADAPRAEFVRLAVPTVSTEQRDAVACRLQLGLGVTVELTGLPGAAWLASVAEALG